MSEREGAAAPPLSGAGAARDTPSHEPLALADVRQARERIAGNAIRTPIVRLDTGDAASDIYLKLEALQPLGSFKIRGASNAMSVAGAHLPDAGVYTASAGNWAQGVAWCARRAGVPCTVFVPDTAPRTKLAAVERLGAGVIPLPRDEWYRIIMEHGAPGTPGLFLHPFSDPSVMAGNGTIALELLEQLPDVDTVLVPYGGGGLSCGIASVLRELAPRVRVVAVEVSAGAPLTASFAAGRPTAVPFQPSFVDAIGGKVILPEMWALARRLLAGSVVVELAAVADAVRALATRAHVVAEGAGAAPVAAALAGAGRGGTVACIVSGGNIDPDRLATILQGGVPS